MIQTAIFGAVIIIMAFTPFLGYIPLGVTRATIIHVPVILASLLLGPKRGSALGLLFGATSFINNTINPTITSFVFTPFYNLDKFQGGWQSIVICFIPRILVGLIPYYIYKLIKRIDKKAVSSFGLFLAGVIGSMVNTLLVMNLIFWLFRESYANANAVPVQALYGFILSGIGMIGVPEAIAAGVLTFFIGRILMKRNIRERLGFINDFSD